MLREHDIILREQKVMRRNGIHFIGTKSVYVLLCPFPGSVVSNKSSIHKT